MVVGPIVFVEAIQKAREFTRPVVISRRRGNGKCESGIGAFVVINPDGWAVTASHIIEEAGQLAQQAQSFQKAEADRANIAADTSLTKKERARRLRELPRKTNATITDTSAWWSWDAAGVSTVQQLPAVDIAFFKLDPFSAKWIAEYPVFKDPSQPMEQGRSLCRIGFPFHSIVPIFHEDKNAFELPPGSLPLPFFPIDGLFTRTVVINPPKGVKATPGVPLRFLETSSPGLRGQSGGPIFDRSGSIWGIQSSTQHFPLGFSPPVPGGKRNEKEHQFLNVGWGAHVETIVALMRDIGISFQLSER